MYIKLLNNFILVVFDTNKVLNDNMKNGICNEISNLIKEDFNVYLNEFDYIKNNNIEISITKDIQFQSKEIIDALYNGQNWAF